MSEIFSQTIVSTRRSAELALLISAWLVGSFAWLLVDVSTHYFSATTWISLSICAVLLACAHLVVRWQAPFADPVLLPSIATLNMIGLAMIHRLDVANALQARAKGKQPPRPDVYLQLTWLVVGLVLFCLILWLVQDHRRLQRLTFTSGVVGVALLFLPLLPVVGLSLIHI